MDAGTIRLATVFLGFLAIGCVVGVVVLAAMSKEPPAILAALGGMAAGWLGGLLVTQRGQGNNNQGNAPNGKAP